MATPTALHTALLALLAGSTVTTYDATVPTAPPAGDDGRVYPYRVVWPSAGYTPDEARSIVGVVGTELTWPVQVTVAAGDPTWCLDAANLTRRLLEGVVLVAGAGPLREEQGAPPMTVDVDVTPPRFFVPLLFRCMTA